MISFNQYDLIKNDTELGRTHQVKSEEDFEFEDIETACKGFERIALDHGITIDDHPGSCRDDEYWISFFHSWNKERTESKELFLRIISEDGNLKDRPDNRTIICHPQLIEYMNYVKENYPQFDLYSGFYDEDE